MTCREEQEDILNSAEQFVSGAIQQDAEQTGQVGAGIVLIPEVGVGLDTLNTNTSGIATQTNQQGLPLFAANNDINPSSPVVRNEQQIINNLFSSLKTELENRQANSSDETLKSKDETIQPVPLYGLNKNSFFIEETYFDGTIKTSRQNFSISNKLPVDRVRYFNGSYSVVDEKNDLVMTNTMNYFKQYIKLADYENNVNYGSSTFGSGLETYILSFSKNIIGDTDKSPSLKKAFLYGGSYTGSIQDEKDTEFNFLPLVDPQKDFTDTSFELELPFETNELLESVSLLGASLVSIKDDYTFYVKSYEELLANQNSVLETTLPNLYVMTKVMDYDSQNPDFINLINLAGNIELVKPKNWNKKDKIVVEYYDNFSTVYNQFIKDDKFDKYNNKCKNFIFSTDIMKKIDLLNEKKYVFPMSIEFTIPTDKTAAVTQVLKDSDLMDNFVLKLYELESSGTPTLKNFINSEEILEQNISSSNFESAQNSKVESSYSASRKRVEFYNLEDIINDIQTTPIIEDQSKFLLIKDQEKTVRKSQNSNTFINSLKFVIFKGKLQNIIKNNFRTYRDILEGKKAYNETIAYKITKYDSSGIEMQSFWFPNNPDIDIFKFVDTQLKYNKEYIYKIFAYQFVLANKYKQSYILDATKFEDIPLTVKQEAYPIIAKVELLATNKKVIDSPPLSPEIEFVPYRGIDNKMGLFFNGRTGRATLEPITITEQDKNIYKDYKKDLKGNILFAGDDVAKQFEVLRLEFKPRSYEDFSKGLIRRIETDIDPVTVQSATAAALIDDVLPNKKYYYIFRTIDIHDHLSNPSAVFEIEIVNQNGAIFPIIKEVEFEKPKYVKYLEVRRFIKITPATQHVIINEEKSKLSSFERAEEANKELVLGISDVAKPWGKTFKMVVTSKQTGKKMEIKFKFRHETQQNK